MVKSAPPIASDGESETRGDRCLHLRLRRNMPPADSIFYAELSGRRSDVRARFDHPPRRRPA
jgi:hypothetical protein